MEYMKNQMEIIMGLGCAHVGTNDLLKKMKIFIYNPNEEGCSAQLIRTNGSDLSRSNFIPFAIISPPAMIILPLGFSYQCHFNNIGSSSHAVHRYQVILLTKHVLNDYIENFIAFIICHK